MAEKKVVKKTDKKPAIPASAKAAQAPVKSVQPAKTAPLAQPAAAAPAAPAAPAKPAAPPYAPPPPTAVKRSDVPAWLGSIKDRTVYAPHRVGDAVVFKPLTDAKKADIALPRPAVPPKHMVFCQTEKLLDFESKDGSYEFREPAAPRPAVIVGMRPCDAKALLFLDEVFTAANHGFVDPMYAKRRENTVIVALSCNKPEPNCFCTSTGGSPSATDGADVILTEIGDRYVVETLTAKGGAFMTKTALARWFSAATKNDIERAQMARAAADESVPRKVKVRGIKEILDVNFDNPYWHEVGARCLGCGICTYTCPTCHCFDIQDERTRAGGRRFRVWDTCQSLEYTQHAGGHNPRPEKGQRTRNRIFDKYKYTVDAFGKLSCVGCGRCSSQCPEAIDLIEILETVRTWEAKK